MPGPITPRPARAQAAAGGGRAAPAPPRARAARNTSTAVSPAAGTFERGAGRRRVVPGQVRSIRTARRRSLALRRPHVHHQPAIDPPQPDHHQRGEQVQHHFLRRAGLQARRSGDRLRRRFDSRIGCGRGSQQRRRDCWRCRSSARRARPASREHGHGEGRAAAGGEADHHIVAADRHGASIAAAAASASSSAFSIGARQRRLAAGDQQHQALRRPVEGRRQLGAVLHADAPRGAGAGIDQPAAPRAAAAPPPRPPPRSPAAPPRTAATAASWPSHNASRIVGRHPSASRSRNRGLIVSVAGNGRHRFRFPRVMTARRSDKRYAGASMAAARLPHRLRSDAARAQISFACARKALLGGGVFRTTRGAPQFAAGCPREPHRKGMRTACRKRSSPRSSRTPRR